jgi:hypothetical protein
MLSKMEILKERSHLVRENHDVMLTSWVCLFFYIVRRPTKYPFFSNLLFLSNCKSNLIVGLYLSSF